VGKAKPFVEWGCSDGAGSARVRNTGDDCWLVIDR
jgi:hypothetical protein